MENSLEDMAAALAANWAPIIDHNALPESERPHALSLTILLELLNSFTDDFTQALALFDYIENQNQQPGSLRHLPVKWSTMAGHEAVMSVWNFADALNYMQRSLNKCPTLRAALGKHVLRAALCKFNVTFPDAKGTRDTSAHPVGQLGTPESRKRNTLIQSGSTLIVYSALQGRNMVYSRKGRLLSLEISQDTLAKLQAIKVKVFSAFRVVQDNGLTPEPAAPLKHASQQDET